MRIVNLGRVDAPLIFFGGPYSNLHALEALFEQAKRIGVQRSHMISTGDAVAYCADGAECINLMRSAGIHLLAGNCEKQLSMGAQDCGCGFDEGSACDILSNGWYPHALRTIDQDARNWLGMAPDLIILSHHEQHVAVVHGGVRDIARFLWSVSSEREFREELEELARLGIVPDVVIAGHSGIAFARRIDGTCWINAGAVGMPENSGQTSTRYLVLEDGEPRFAELTYDAQAASEAMQEAGLQQGYEKALLTGYWPSEDILPHELRNNAS